MFALKADECHCTVQLTKGNQVLISCGLQVIAGTIEEMSGDKSNATMTLKLEQSMAYLPEQRCIIASTTQNLPRIHGFGSIVE